MASSSKETGNTDRGRHFCATLTLKTLGGIKLEWTLGVGLVLSFAWFVQLFIP